MLPEGRLSSIPISGTLLDPGIGNKLLDYEMGGIALSDPSQGLLYQLWQVRYDTVTGNVLLSAEEVPETIAFTRANITEVSLTFDQNMHPFVAFVEGGVGKFWWYDTTIPAQVFEETLIATARTPRCSLDDKRSSQTGISDIILTYSRNGALCYRQQRDRYLVEYIPQQGSGGPTVATNTIYYIGFNSQLRLEFIYGSTPILYDMPDIMKQQVLSQKSPVEVIDVVFDFYHTMLFGDVIEEAAAVITIQSGTGSTTGMLIGTPTHTDRTVTQQVSGGTAGDIYKISMSARTAASCVYVVEGLLYVNDSPAIEPPSP